jgi:hypothetical protein
MILLHGTSLHRWRQIQSQGFSVPADKENLGIALADHASFGNLALAGYHAEFRAYWDNYPSPRDDSNPPVLLALDASYLQDHLQVDPAAVKMPFEMLLGASRDDLKARWDASGQKWQDSLAIFGAVSLPLALIESLVCLPLKPVGSPGARRDSTGLGFAGQILDHTNARSLWSCSHTHPTFYTACACASQSINRRRLLQHPLRAALVAAGLSAQQLREIGQNPPPIEVRTLV